MFRTKQLFVRLYTSRQLCRKAVALFRIRFREKNQDRRIAGAILKAAFRKDRRKGSCERKDSERFRVG